MKFPLIFLFLTLLVFTPMVLAQPPPQQNVNTNIGLDVQITHGESFENRISHLFNAHVFNISDGLRVNNDSTDCVFHLFDNKGDHPIDQAIMNYDVLGLDWEFNVTGGNFTRNGDYNYLIVCNATNIGGFLSTGFEITGDGRPSNPFPVQFSIILFSFLLIGVGLVKERFRFFQYMGSILMMIMGVLTLFPGYSFINWSTLTGLSLGTVLIGMGFYFLLEPAFSREEQEEHFEQKGGGD